MHYFGKIVNLPDSRGFALTLYSLLRLGTADPSSVARRASRGTCLGAQALGAHQLTYFSHLKTCFKQKFRLKMRIFFRKVVKIAAASGDPPPNPRWPPVAVGSAPRPPRCNYHLLLQHFVECFSST